MWKPSYLRWVTAVHLEITQVSNLPPTTLKKNQIASCSKTITSVWSNSMLLWIRHVYIAKTKQFVLNQTSFRWAPLEAISRQVRTHHRLQMALSFWGDVWGFCSSWALCRYARCSTDKTSMALLSSCTGSRVWTKGTMLFVQQWQSFWPITDGLGYCCSSLGVKGVWGN